MDVSIEAIQFNYDSKSVKTDALTIRKNESEEINVPEWRLDPPQRFAVAYARSQGNELCIAVRLKRYSLNVRSVMVSAQSNIILGEIAETEVVFSGNDLSDFKILKLKNATVGSAKVGRSDVKLNWTLIATSSDGTKTSFTQSTEHVIYTLLDQPNPPWGPDKEDPKYEYELPWADVLELACKWAAGAADQITAASMITREIHNLGLKHVGRKSVLGFDRTSSYSRFALNGTDRIDFTKFLELVKNPGTMKVNCTDCAILVSSFANILGCNLFQSQMGTRFRTNQIREIGSSKEGAVVYDYHEVAWEYPCTADANLFDCFLQVDSDPSTSEFTPLLPVNIRFGNHKSKNYHYLLVEDGMYCVTFEDTKTRRQIAREKFVVKRIHPELEKILKAEFHYSSWHNFPSPDRLFLGPIDKLNGEFFPVEWNRARARVLQGDLSVLDLSESIWQSPDADTAVRVLSYRCVSISEARAFLLNLLGEFQIAIVRARYLSEADQDRFIVGDLAFSGPADQVLLFVRSNVVVFLQNAGDSSISLLSFAQAIDAQILKALNQQETALAQSSLQATEVARSAPPTTESTIHKKEKSVMSIEDFVGEWSSIRPYPKVKPTDMRRNGVFKIKKYDPKNGKVEGDYYDLEYFEKVDFEGVILPVPGTYSFIFSHDVKGTSKKRYYQGYFIAEVNEVSVVAGTWRDQDTGGDNMRKTDDKEDIRAQIEGVWVVTKP